MVATINECCDLYPVNQGGLVTAGPSCRLLEEVVLELCCQDFWLKLRGL